MPCNLSGWEIAALNAQDMMQLKAEIEKLTRLLCEAMKLLKSPYVTTSDDYSPELNAWWSQHKINDTQREQNKLDDNFRKSQEVYESVRDDLLKIIDKITMDAIRKL